MVMSNREPLQGVVDVDQAEISFRVGDTFFEPGNAGKILITGAVEVIDRGTNQANRAASTPNSSHFTGRRYNWIRDRGTERPECHRAVKQKRCR